jgi:hypothetical protein
MLNLRKQASETLSEITDASKKVVTTTEQASIVLLAVAAVSLLALGVAFIALEVVVRDRRETR